MKLNYGPLPEPREWDRREYVEDVRDYGPPRLREVLTPATLIGGLLMFAAMVVFVVFAGISW